MKMNDVLRDIRDSILKPIGEFFSLRYQTIIVFANFLALALGFVYILDSGSNIFWNIYTFFIILTFLGNLISALAGGKYRYLDYGYLLFSVFVFSMIPLLNTGVSFDVRQTDTRSLLSNLLLLSLYLFAGIIAYVRIVYTEKMAEQGKTEKRVVKESRVKNIIKIVLIVISSAALLIGIYVCYDLLTRNKDGIIEVFIPEFSAFYALIFISLTFFIIRLGKDKTSLFNLSVFSLGLLIFIICMLPFMNTPTMIRDSEKSYTAAFGPYMKNSETNTNSIYFKDIPFSVSEYFFGVLSHEYTVEENVLFYEGKSGADNGKKFYFDVYLPPKGKELPGKNSVLIRIHGGAWTIGDKGSFDFPQVNKYFASQGYVVFDIQYGLNNQKKKFVEGAGVPENVQGAFGIDDMIRHIGMFIKYLKEHYKEYGANLDSVFISGNSAGGQLACAAGLALSSGKFPELLNPSGIKIKGIILLYPANGLSTNIGIPGTASLVDPALLVEKNSPPCLIFQGDLDGLVDPKIALAFRDAYLKKGNDKCAVLMMPLAAHGTDFYFAGYYNQVFMYYMERFMYQFR